MVEPTQKELERARDVIQWILGCTEEVEPQAGNFINACSTVIEEMSTEPGDYK